MTGSDRSASHGISLSEHYLRKTQKILQLFDVERSDQAIWQWFHQVVDSIPDPPEAKPKRVVADETAVKINGGLCWVYTTIDLDSKLILGAELF